MTQQEKRSRVASWKHRRGKSPGRGTLKQRVKTARRRSTSSTQWLERQLNDPYVAAAKLAGYRSRAAFKLAQIDDRFHFLKKDARVVDLGAAPGGWTQIAVERVGLPRGTAPPCVVAIDVEDMEPILGATVMTMDVSAPDAAHLIKQNLGGQANIVLSDMAAPATGHRQTDHARIIALCETALEIALEVLAPGGTFVAKVLQGGTEHELLATMKRHFRTVRHFKPEASRSNSAEMYVVGMGLKGS